jgi:ABC-2 type transport system permease protein
VATTEARTTTLGRVPGQAAAASRSIWRDPGGLFFALVMPAGLFLFFGATQGDSVLKAIGLPYAVFFGASMTVCGTAVALFTDLPQAVALAREHGVLKRLRGTPLAPTEYLAGRVVAATGLAVLIAAVVLVLGTVFFDLHLHVVGALLGLGILVLGSLTLAACGLAVAGTVRTARAVGAVALILLFPLAFFSDVFIINPPGWMHTVGSFFPLRHLQNALVDAWRPDGPVVGWAHLGVLLGWLLVASAFSARTFRWTAGSE